MKNFIKNNSFYFLGGITLILCWEIASICYDSEIVFPTIKSILISVKNLLLEAKTYKIILYSFLRLIIAFVSSFLMAFLLSYISRKNTKIKQLLLPLISLIKATPVASIIIIILILVGHQYSSIVIAFLIMFPIQYEGLYNAYNSVDKDIKDEIAMISKTNMMIIKEIYIPLALPTVVTTVLQSFSLGIKSLVMAELLTTPKYSIGAELLMQKNALNMSAVIAWSLLLVVVAIIIEILLNKLKTKSEEK